MPLFYLVGVPPIRLPGTAPESIAMVMMAEPTTAEAITMATIMAEATAAVIMMVVMMNAGTAIRGAKYTTMWQSFTNAMRRSATELAPVQLALQLATHIAGILPEPIG